MEGIEALPTYARTRIHVTESGCWEWNGSRNKAGYGRIWIDRRHPESAHRYVYQRLVGPIPEGLVLDHLCRNPPCCNPAHLEPVTPGENTARGISPSALNAVKTQCKHGHEFTAENTGYTQKGERRCKACAREIQRRLYPVWYARYRAKHPAKERIARCPLGHAMIGNNLRLTEFGKKRCWKCTRASDARRAAAQDHEWQAWLGVDHVPTVAERLAKMSQLLTTHCPAGHEYTLENTTISRQRRYCRACHAESERRRKAKLHTH